MRVGFIGLGSQGGPMARRIVEGGYETTLWARREASLEPYADTTAKTAGSPAELAAASDLVCLCVVGDDDVKEVLNGQTGVLAGLASGGIVAIHSTVHPDTVARVAELAPEGVSVLDAPISGGVPGAREARLAIMVGGDHAAFARARPAFDAMGSLVVHLGPAGSGLAAKLARNLMGYVSYLAAQEGRQLAEVAGVDLDALRTILDHTGRSAR